MPPQMLIGFKARNAHCLVFGRPNYGLTVRSILCDNNLNIGEARSRSEAATQARTEYRSRLAGIPGP